MIDCIPHMISTCTKEGTIVTANKKWKEYSGLSDFDPHASWLQIVHPNDIATARDKWDRYTSIHAPYESTHRIRCITGEYRWHRSVAVQYEINDIHGVLYVCTNTDIHAEILLANSNTEGLKREETYARRVLHSSDPVLHINSTDGIILSANFAVQTILQYRPDELIGKPCTLLMEDDSANSHIGKGGYLEKYNKLRKSGHQTAIGTANQIHARCKDGTSIPITLIIDSFEKSGNHIFIAVLRPVQMDIRLQQTLNKSKEAFLSTTSHELRTPLFGLLGTISMIREKQIPSDLQEEIAIMEANTLSLLSIVNNMIDFYLISQLHATPKKQSFNPKQLIADVCNRMSGFAEKSVEYTFDIDSTVPTLLFSDPDFIEHILVNLLSNALRFTHNGSVTTHAKVAQKEKGSELVLTVRDTGIGIEPEFYPQIFQPFTQSNATDSRYYQGVGLGLATVKSIVNVLGGSVSFTSSRGRGTEFTVDVPVDLMQLPISPSSPATGACPMEKISLSGSPIIFPSSLSSSSELIPEPISSPETPEIEHLNKTILVVDDNKMNQLIIKRMLERLHIQVFLANHGAEAIEILYNSDSPKFIGYSKFDCMIVDCQMPVMDGYLLTENIRKWENSQKESVPHLLIFALSASVSSDIEKKSKLAGMDGFIAKPVSFNVLCQHIITGFHGA